MLDKEKTTKKYGSYKNEVYAAWKKNGSYNKIVKEFLENDLSNIVRWAMGYEATLLEDIVKEEKLQKSKIRYLRTWAKSAFYNALIAGVRY